jgi:signal transduction histidine kinase
MIELAAIVAGWPLALTLAAVVAAQGLRAGRRRSALNRALHELRRPLQAIALAGGAPGWGDAPPALQSSVQLAAAALERLDREVNGGGLRRPHEAIEVRPLLEAALRRWQSRAGLAGASLSLRWRAGRAVVIGDRVELSQALDNLIVNAIEHGGPPIRVEATVAAARLRIAVLDGGACGESEPRGHEAVPVLRAPARIRALARRWRTRGRRGNGLQVVARIAAEHGGRFIVHHGPRGTVAALELPLARLPTPALASPAAA